jgi:hypothetical protein
MAIEPAYEFQNFMILPDHIIVNVMSQSKFEDRLNMTETCKHLDMLHWSSPKLVEKVSLIYSLQWIEHTDYLQEVIKDLQTILSHHKRKYKTFKLCSFSYVPDRTFKSLLKKVMKYLGGSVTELRLGLAATNLTSKLVGLLRNFPHLEKLTLCGFPESSLKNDSLNLRIEGLFQNLKHLCIVNFKSSVLKVFQTVETLESFEFKTSKAECAENVLSFGITAFEHFLIQQNRLKKLKIHGMEKFGILEENRIDDIHFQLETLHLIGFFVHRNNALKFYRKQKHIKDFHLINFHCNRIFPDRPDYANNILREIFSLPKLEKLTIRHGLNITEEDFEHLITIRNKSVKELEFWPWEDQDLKCSMIIENFVEIFPNIDKIYLKADEVFFERFPCKKLHCFSVGSPNQFHSFSFKPSKMEMHHEIFENLFIDFLKHQKRIDMLFIGHENWIGTEGLSLNFVKQTLKILDKLNSLEIFNPLQPEETIQLLEAKKAENEIFKYEIHVP